MLYLGIDQHKRQLTVNLRGDGGSVGEGEEQVQRNRCQEPFRRPMMIQATVPDTFVPPSTSKTRS